MTTPYRGYTELPGSAVPDVPYRVNLALREIDADVKGIEDAAAATDERLDAGLVKAGVRISAIEVLGGLTPGDVTDATAADLISNDESLTAEAIDVRLAGLPSNIVLSTDANAPLTEGQVLFVIEQAWSPNLLANVQMWFDAQQQTAVDGALIGSISDHSGLGRHAVQVSDANKPVFSATGLNGKSCFTFGGTKRAAVPTFTAVTGPVTVIAVATTPAPTATSEYLFNTTGSTSDVALYRSATSGALGTVRGTSLTASNPSPAAHVLVAEFGVGSDASSISVDGTVLTTGTTTDTVNLTALTLGARNDLTRFWQGKIGEFIVVGGILTLAEKDKLAEYVATKWAI